MASGDKDAVPSWDGTLPKFDDYAIDAKAYVRGTRRDDRYACGTRLWRRLSGRARQAARDVLWGNLETPEGADYLVAMLRTKLGATSVHDAGKYLGRWIFEMQRKASEPMTAYLTRDDVAYEDVVRAFGTEYFRNCWRDNRSEPELEWQRLRFDLYIFMTALSNRDEDMPSPRRT